METLLDIVHVDTSTEWRGGQRQLLLLARGLSERGHRQRVLCAPGTPIAEALGVVGGVELLMGRPGSHPRNAWLLGGLRPDVVAAHSSPAHTAAVLAGHRPVVHRRVDFAPNWGWKYRRAAELICVSEAVRRVAGRGVVVHSAVPAVPEAEPAELGEGRVVLAVGALVDHKDHRTLAEAARGLQARVLVAGQGPLQGELKEMGGLELLGQRDDVPALLARADVFVHCSKTEGLGTAVLDAMSAGVPVVATASGGVPEAIGDCGVLVPVGNADALREALREALEGRHGDVDAARRRVRGEFSVERMVEATEAVYRRVAEERASAGTIPA